MSEATRAIWRHHEVMSKLDEILVNQNQNKQNKPMDEKIQHALKEFAPYKNSIRESLEKLTRGGFTNDMNRLLRQDFEQYEKLMKALYEG